MILTINGIQIQLSAITAGEAFVSSYGEYGGKGRF